MPPPAPACPRSPRLARRSITILPQALSPHSLASLPPGFTYSDSMASLGASYMSGSSYPSAGGGELLGASFDERRGVGVEGEGEESEAPEGSELSESEPDFSGHGGRQALERLRRGGSPPSQLGPAQHPRGGEGGA